MHFVYHASEVVQSSLLRSPGFWLPTLSTERHVHGKHANEVAVLKSAKPLRVVRLATRNSCFFLACQKIVHPLLRSTGPSARAIASRTSPVLTREPRDLHFRRHLSLV